MLFVFVWKGDRECSRHVGHVCEKEPFQVVQESCPVGKIPENALRTARRPRTQQVVYSFAGCILTDPMTLLPSAPCCLKPSFPLVRMEFDALCTRHNQTRLPPPHLPFLVFDWPKESVFWEDIAIRTSLKVPLAFGQVL